MSIEANPLLRWSRRLLLTAVVLLPASGLAWLSVTHDRVLDWTEARGNTLSEPSRALLARMTAPVEVTAYVSREPRKRQAIRRLVDKYRRSKSNLSLRFVDPSDVPQEVRELGISRDGELSLSYVGRRQRVADPSESTLTNALSRLVRAEDRWLAYVAGHGERDLLGRANHDLGAFGQHLQSTGIRVQPLVLAAVDAIPGNTALLVLAHPEVDLLAAEVARIQRYLSDGGNLLWLTEPGAKADLGWLGDTLGIEAIPGMVLDPDTPMLGIDRRTVTVLTRYPEHPATQGFDVVTVLVETAALQSIPDSGWQAVPLLQTHERLWVETSLDVDTASFQPDADHAGPLLVGVSLERGNPNPAAAGRQRVIVVGDADFLSNAYLANAGNLELGTKLVNWLTHDDALLDIALRERSDRVLTLSKSEALIIGGGALFVVPALFLVMGGVVWWRRRRF